MSEYLQQHLKKKEEEGLGPAQQTVETTPTAIESSNQVQPPEEEEEQGFPGPNRNTRSQVDLSIPANKQTMDDEHNVWWNMPYRVDGVVNEERATLKDSWYQKYYGKTQEEINREQGGFYPGANNPLANLEGVFKGLSVPGLALADFGMDAVGLLPGGAQLDDKWDEATKLDNDLHQGVRRVLSVVLPSIYTGGVTAGALQGLPKATSWGSKLKNALVATGAFSAQEAAIIGISDEGEEHNTLRVLSDFFPGVFGEKGFVPISDWAKTLDEDSASVRRWKNMLDTSFLSIAGTALGAYIKIKGGKKTLDWMEPIDKSSADYKAREILKNGDPEKIIRIQEINEILSTQKVSRAVQTELEDEILTLRDALGSSSDIEDILRNVEISKGNESTEAATRKLANRDPSDTRLDPDITPGILDEASSGRQSVPPGNVARNIADTTAIKSGASSGDPAPIITEAMRTKGLMVGSTSRDAVLGVAEETRDIGRFNAIVDGFRFTAKQMDAAAWDIYTSIMATENMDDLRGLFIDNKDVKSMLLGKFDVEYINEEQARAAAFAMRDLTDRFLGRDIALSSARVMDTLGREASTMSQAILDLQPFVDDDRVMDLVIDKLQFLMDEYALNKYISGWQLRNKNWFDQVPPKDIDTVIDTLTQEFRSAENAIHAKNLRFTKTLKELSETNPIALRPLIDAFAASNGDVDTIDKLMKWAADQVTPMGLIKSPDPKQLNLFARGAWGVRYNNVLSGLSPFRAGQGNSGMLTLKPITGILGHGIWGAADNFEGLKRTFYYNGALFETNKRALRDGFTMMKKAHKDPELMVKTYRKDFIYREDKNMGILEDMRLVWEKEGNWGRILQFDMAKTMHDMAKHPAMRYGMTGMVFPDTFTNTHIAHWLSRVRAYDDVFAEFGFADWDKILLAEKKHYTGMFDANGLPTDKVLKSLSGEIALNLDDGLATWINQATTAYPIAKDLFMFPRTASNLVKNASSWTPITLIPGINKYSKTLYAKTDDDIAKALAEHGIDMASTPNARVIFENLRAEYTGRMAFSSLLAGTMWQYAVAGNIRGNGHYNAGIRKKERDQFGYEPKTINIGGKWVSYKGLIGIEQMLSVVGDMAYYSKDIDQPFLEDWQSKMLWTISAGFLNETPLQGFEPIVAALNGDLTAWSRLTANSFRSWIPLSSGLGVLSDGITNSLKDIQGEVHEYVFNRLPGFSSTLAEQRDIWTGEPLNDIDNHFLRWLNAMSPIKVSGTREPWRVWLMETGWDGLGRLKKDSTGSYEYSSDERELIYKYMGEEKMYLQIQQMMNSKKFNSELNLLRKHRASGADLENERIKLRTEDLPVIKRINQIVKTAQKRAEIRLLRERPHIANTILHQRLSRQYMKAGDVENAARMQQKELQTRELLQMSK